MKSELQTAYVLHTRAYRDTSMLVDFFTPEFGRITAVARGARSAKSAKRQRLAPFNRLLISYQGKTDLKLLTHSEPDSPPVSLSGHHLFSGFYANELLVRLLPENDPHPRLFACYEQCLVQLHAGLVLEPVLRRFELELLAELGYGVQFDCDCRSGDKIFEAQFYHLDVQQGFYCADECAPDNSTICGAHLLAIHDHAFVDAEVRLTAKKITRALLQPLLGHRPLRSRELFA